MEKDGPKVKYFISGIILGFLVMFYGIISNSSFLIGMGSIVIGIDVVFFPFYHAGNNRFFGISKAKLVGPRSRYITDSSWNMGGDYSLMNRDAEAAALTCGSLFFTTAFWIIARNTSGSFPTGKTAWPLPSSQNVVMPRLHRICFVIILIYSTPRTEMWIHFRLAV